MIANGSETTMGERRHGRWTMEHFTIIRMQSTTGPVFRLSGEIDGSSAFQVLRHVKQCPGMNLTLDFSQVTEIGEFGARVLGAGLKEICRTGITIDVDGLRPGLSELLCIGGVFEAIVG